MIFAQKSTLLEITRAWTIFFAPLIHNYISLNFLKCGLEIAAKKAKKCQKLAVFCTFPKSVIFQMLVLTLKLMEH